MRRQHSFLAVFCCIVSSAAFVASPARACGKRTTKYTPESSGSTGLLMVAAAPKQQADSVPLPLAKGLLFAFDDLIGKVYSILKAQEQISGRKFAPIESRFVQMAKKYDVSKSGALTLDEFRELVGDGIVWRSMLLPQSTAFGELPSAPTRKDIEAIFLQFDSDRSGCLDTRELTKALVALGLQVEDSEGGRPKTNPTLKGTESAYWAPPPAAASSQKTAGRGEVAAATTLPISLKPWGAPLEALFEDDFGAVKTMALFNAIKLADGAFGQFQSIVAGTWTGMPPNIKGFIPRLLKITAALRLLEEHYTTRASWEEDGDSQFLKEAYTDAKKEVEVLMLRLATLMFLLVQREGKVSRLTNALLPSPTACNNGLTDGLTEVGAPPLWTVPQVPLKGGELAHLQSVLAPLGVTIPPGCDYARLAKLLDEDGLSQRMWQGSLLDELDVGAKDFAAYFRLRKASKSDLSAFESSCYGQAVDKSMAAVLKNKKDKDKSLALAELQALQALPC